jgi:HEAT repeat protein
VSTIGVRISIKEALQSHGGSATPNELKKTCVEEKRIPASTYYRELRKMQKSGEIARSPPPRYELVEERRPPVNRKDVRICLKNLKKTTDVDLRIEFAKDFEKLSESDGFEKEPDVLVVARRLLDDQSESIRVLSVKALTNIVDRASDRRIVERVRVDNQEKMGEIALNDFSIACRQNAIDFLGKIGDERAIEVLFEIVKQEPSDRDYSQLSYVLRRALTSPNSRQVKQHKKDIRQLLLSLLRNDREAVKERAKGLLDDLRQAQI